MSAAYPIRVLLIGWTIAITVGGGLLMARHHRTLQPVTAALRGGQPGSGVKLIHILVPGCACSARIARQLAGQPGEIHWADGPEVERLRQDHGVPGGPWLLAFDRQGDRFYSGGYGREVDAAMLARLAAGQPEPVRRSYGCAFSKSQEKSNPSDSF